MRDAQEEWRRTGRELDAHVRSTSFGLDRGHLEKEDVPARLASGSVEGGAAATVWTEVSGHRWLLAVRVRV